MAKIIAVDFDGTLYKGNTPFPSVNPENLNMNLIRAIEQCQSKYPDDLWILWTCRDREEFINPAVSAIASVSNIRWDAINDNVDFIKQKYGNSLKIVADLYIDDFAASPAQGLVMINDYIQRGGAEVD